MILFITGGPCTGKSTLARSLAGKLDFDLCQGDHIKLTLRKLSGDSDPKINTNTYRAWKDLGFEESEETVYPAALEHSQVFWPVITYIADEYQSRGEDLIVDSSFLLPEFFETVTFENYKVLFCAPSAHDHKFQAQQRNEGRIRRSEESKKYNSYTMFASVRILQAEMSSRFESLKDGRILFLEDSRKFEPSLIDLKRETADASPLRTEKSGRREKIRVPSEV